ncbi:MAG: ComF family protein [Candidatus Omnitrophica bacterium]|nr:ComF family protein [Candidatus Omnitrophota bacterium]
MTYIIFSVILSTMINPTGFAKSAYSAFLNLAYPKSCQGCGTRLDFDNKYYICADCFKEIKINKPPLCIKCSRSLYGLPEISALCGVCLSSAYHFDKAFVCCSYEGLIKELIHKFKYNNRKYLIYLFDKIIEDFMKDKITACDINMAVPVPLYGARARERGFDQALLLSKNISRALNIPLNYNILIRNRNTAQQANLGKTQRFNNIKGAFSVREKSVFNKKNLLLVDDVFTTGATANECAKVLKQSGAKKVFLLTLARG